MVILRNKIRKIEKMVFEISINSTSCLTSLKKLYKEMVDIKEEFLDCNFNKCTLEELEEIRFAIQEQTLNLKMMIKDCINKNISDEIISMNKLWNSNKCS